MSADCVILGASFDTPEENRKFAEDQSFGFRLLSDVDRSVGTSYEAARAPDEQYPDFPRRVAYLIDPEGIVHKSYEVTDTGGFASDVLADLDAAQG